MCVFLVFYLKTTIYTFPDPTPFSGDHWYNPYADLSGTLFRANFHAHSHCWGGLTHGEDTEEELVSAYRERGYDIPGISNYHYISTVLADDPLYIPLYEHGLNVQKIHALVLGAQRVSTTSFPYHFSVHETQQMLGAASAAGELTALAHPVMGRLSMEDMRRLTNYNLMEVGNTLGMSSTHWDAALSAGRPAWILCNDDVHSLEKEEAFIKWNMIYASEPTATAALEALRAGRHYGVESYDTQCDENTLLSVRVENDTLKILLENPVNQLNLHGQGGIKKVSAVNTRTVHYRLTPGDSYIRAEIHQDHCVWYLNPVVRTPEPGVMPQMPVAEMDGVRTWLVRLGVVMLIVAIVLLSWRMTQVRRR